MMRDTATESTVRQKYVAIADALDERALRLWAAAESRAIGYGGDALVASATGLARATIRGGREEISVGSAVERRQRRPGAGRKPLTRTQEGWVAALEAPVSPTTRGDPMSPLTRDLAAAVERQGFRVSHTSVGGKLHELDYSLHVLRKHRDTFHGDWNYEFRTALKF